MRDFKKYCGIDISSETIDICIQNQDNTKTSMKLSNSSEGFKVLWKCTGRDYHLVMESTGVYHLPLAFFLHGKNAQYSIVNALQIKRYIQMNLERNKSDKKDALYICNYGIDQTPEQYKMPDQLYFEYKALNNAIEGITNEITIFKNKIHSMNKLNLKDNVVTKIFAKIIIELQTQLQNLEVVLNKKLNACPKSYTEQNHELAITATIDRSNIDGPK